MVSHALKGIAAIGQRVDPLIARSISKGAATSFLSILKYHFETGGKRMRAAFVILSCLAAGGNLRDALGPAAAVEMIHNYSLIMDDLIDQGKVRRGKPTVRVMAGDAVSLLVAMYYREVLDDLIGTGVRANKVRKTAVNAMKEIIDGERLDMLFEQAGRNDPYVASNRIKEPSFREYLEMIGKKTAALFKAAGEIGAQAAGADGNIVRVLGQFGWNSGLAFQVMDDVLDICGSKTGKQRAKDVFEHKLGNAVLLVAMRYLPSKQRNELFSILRSNMVSTPMAHKAQTLVAITPAEKDSRAIASAYLNNAKSCLSNLRESVYKDSLLSLADFMAARRF